MSDSPIDLEVVKKVPKAVATRYCLIAIQLRQGNLLVNINDPLDFYAIEDIKLITGFNIEVQICNRDDILNSIHEAYSEIETQAAATGANLTAAQEEAMGFVDISEAADDTPIVSLINSTLYKAYSAGASDIHIEPFEHKTKVRIRVDGHIVEYLNLSVALHNSIAARIKILSGLDIAEKRAPQDGHFRAKLEDLEINVRVSTIPTVYGEKLVLRLLNQNTELDNANTFGMEQDDYEKMMQILKNPHGIIYFTGPTGSGKTTTQYLVVERLSKSNVNIATIEDPVERMLPNINQSQVNPLAGLTFETGLRSILRQDPDIVMIGETRDTETAKISIRSALTGHLVLSSLHTNDSVSAIVRLLDMGVEDYLLASSLVGIIAQRLVKKICPFCYAEYKPTEYELSILGEDKPELLAKGTGCHNCSNTGYKGRVAIHEILIIDGNIRKAISSKTPIDSIYNYLQRENKLKPLQTSLIAMVLDKRTTIDEMLRLTYFVN
jgi:type IV pilus assembly protein PilB